MDIYLFVNRFWNYWDIDSVAAARRACEQIDSWRDTNQAAIRSGLYYLAFICTKRGRQVPER